MMKVYEGATAMETEMVASTLSSAGIECEVRDSAMATMRPLAVRATIWIFNDADFERARSIIEEIESQNRPKD